MCVSSLAKVKQQWKSQGEFKSSCKVGFHGYQSSEMIGKLERDEKESERTRKCLTKETD